MVSLTRRVRTLSNGRAMSLPASIRCMQQTHSTDAHRAATPDLDSSAADALEQRGYGSTPEVSCECDEPDFLEGHEDPAQSQELERQQDA